MLILIRILFITYLIAINFYSFLIVKDQKNAFESGDNCSFKDTKLYIAALLGGALTIFVTMLIFRFRLGNMFLMIFLPVVSVLNVYVAFLLFRNNFGYQVVIETQRNFYSLNAVTANYLKYRFLSIFFQSPS
ncbi:MAG: hypothetical protein ACI4M6_01600 [Christensenellaceae bacterium]